MGELDKAWRSMMTEKTTKSHKVVLEFSEDEWKKITIRDSSVCTLFVINDKTTDNLGVDCLHIRPHTVTITEE